MKRVPVYLSEDELKEIIESLTAIYNDDKTYNSIVNRPSTLLIERFKEELTTFEEPRYVSFSLDYGSENRESLQYATKGKKNE